MENKMRTEGEGETKRENHRQWQKNLFLLMWGLESTQSFLSILYLKFHQNCSVIVLRSPIQSKLSLPLKIWNQSGLISVTGTALVSAAGSNQPAGSGARAEREGSLWCPLISWDKERTGAYINNQPPQATPFHSFTRVYPSLQMG